MVQILYKEIMCVEGKVVNQTVALVIVYVHGGKL